jgi:hypothetical protein
MTTQLTASQHAILAHAISHNGGKLEWFPDNIKGGARKKVIEGLLNRALITVDGTGYFAAAEGYDALGMPRPKPVVADAELEAAVAGAEETWQAAKPRTRDNSKQAQVIAMLKRPEGATISQICEATGWQQHTVRGTFAGAFKKKLGLEITSEKTSGNDRVYHIAG